MTTAPLPAIVCLATMAGRVTLDAASPSLRPRVLRIFVALAWCCGQ
ncbi:hypothetical protein ACNQR7_03585 [Mycolicibacterium senegalense]